MNTVSTNPNTSPVQKKRFWLFYVSLITGFVLFFHFLGVRPKTYWTIINVVHAGLTFVLMHWIKGSPLESSYHPQGKFDKLTFWEQIDDQRQFTPTKKFFTLVPLLILFITAYVAYDALFVNIVFGAIALLPKLPQFHRVRLFGINA